MKTSLTDNTSTTNLKDRETKKWDDGDFVDEMNDRLSSYTNGETPIFTWAEVQTEAQSALDNKKLNK